MLVARNTYCGRARRWFLDNNKWCGTLLLVSNSTTEQRAAFVKFIIGIGCPKDLPNPYVNVTDNLDQEQYDYLKEWVASCLV